jgi:Uma2 family endonuclease
MSLVTERAIRWTTDEYTRMAGLLVGRRTELIDGQVLEMPAIGTAHYTVAQRLHGMLGDFARAGRLAIAAPVIITNFDEPEPDLCVLRHPVELRKIRPEDIEILIEVGDTTAHFDREVKLPRYLAAGVPAVWLVNIADHARPRLDSYTADTSGGMVRVGSWERTSTDAPVVALRAQFGHRSTYAICRTRDAAEGRNRAQPLSEPSQRRCFRRAHPARSLIGRHPQRTAAPLRTSVTPRLRV